MSKALELVIYPRLKRPRYGVDIDQYRKQWKRERKLIESKRLTDSDLAAEYWAAFADTNACADTPDHFSYKTHEAIENTIKRFATLPHYDEVTL